MPPWTSLRPNIYLGLRPHIMDRGFLEKETRGHENNYIFHKVIVIATFFVSKPEHCPNIIFLVMVIEEALRQSYLGNLCA